MKKTSRKLSDSIISLVRKSAERDINSASSPWMYQPKLPASAEKLKK